MRIWQVGFHIPDRVDTFFYPGEIVEEVQSDPTYYLSGKHRKNISGAQVVFTLEGIGGFSDGKHEYKMNPGDAFLAYHSDPDHAYYFPEESKELWRFLWISFYGKYCQDVIMELVGKYGYLYHFPKVASGVGLLNTYSNFDGKVLSVSAFDAAKLVNDVLASLGESYEVENSWDGQNDIVREVRQYAMDNLFKPCTVSMMADELGVSREHLSRVTKQYLGISPLEYIHSCKIAHAERMLIETRLSCKEIADKLSFESASNFTRLFKKVKGITPTQKRESYRESR